MTKDKGYHNQIRNEVINFIKNKYPTPLTSHDEKGDIELSIIGPKDKKIPVSQPDIICLDNTKVMLIIEIELCSTPKHLLGVVFANMISKACSFKKELFTINHPPLFIIVSSKEIEKDGSIKPDQIETVEKEIPVVIQNNSLNIVIRTDNNYKDSLEIILNKIYPLKIKNST